MAHTVGEAGSAFSAWGTSVFSLGLSLQLQLIPGFPEGQTGSPSEGLGAFLAWPVLKPATPTGPLLSSLKLISILSRKVAENGKKKNLNFAHASPVLQSQLYHFPAVCFLSLNFVFI